MSELGRGALVVSLLVGSALLIAGPAVGGEPGLLDGRTFEGTTSEVGGEAGEADALIFADGTFRSAGCDEYGFTATPYTAAEEDGVIRFEATTTSPEEGQITWTGTVEGDRAEATFVWTKEGQDPIEYRFEGTAAGD